MSNDKRDNSVWPILGLGAGVAAGWLLRKFFQDKYDETRPFTTPASEKELVTTVFGEYSQEARNYYREVRDEVTASVAELKMSLKDVDTAKYKELVNDALDKVNEDNTMPKKQVDKLREYLMEDFKTVKEQTKRAAKRTARRARKTAA